MKFFLGCSRSASKMYKYIFSKHSDINISEELKLIYIIPVYKSLVYFYFKYKFIHNDEEKFVNEIFSKLKGTFWEEKSISKDELLYVINSMDEIDLKLLISKILQKDAENKNKIYPGAKFPLYIAYTPFLIKWFPDSKYVFLIRNPIAIYKSQINKHRLKNPVKRFFMIMHVSMMFSFTYFYINKYKDRENFMCIRYENMVKDKYEIIRSLCNFFDIEFNENMIGAPVIESSVGRDKSNENKAQELILPSKLEKYLIKFLNYFPLNNYHRI